jgi:GTP-binding protein
MRKENLRNIAIIAHVDHGKTTLVDGMLQQSGTFRENKQMETRIMDNMDIERERGITINAKNTAIQFKETKINIVDTPGHADFGGEVERSLNMVDGALLLVDAAEGPLPQTRFVLKKALAKSLPIILVINKIDRKDSRIDEVTNEVYDLFIDLDANDEQIEFPILYTQATAGIAHRSLDDGSENLLPLFETIIEKIPGPEADDSAREQFLITNLDYDQYVGLIGVGRLKNGRLKLNTNYTVCHENENISNTQISVLFTFKGLQKIKVDEVEAGDIIGVTGIKNLKIGDSLSSNEDPEPLPRIKIDKPTVSMIFYINDAPFADEGEYLTSRHLKERLDREIINNVALNLEEIPNRKDCFKVSGRGELQMAVLIETLRREGYSLMVSKPQVITREKNGKTQEPVERVFVDVPEEYVGTVTEKLSNRKGRMTHMINHGNGRVDMQFLIPTRGLIGFRSQFLTETRGTGIMNTLFEEYQDWFGPIPHRKSGAIIADRTGKVTTYSCLAMTDRGELFVEPGTMVYSGMIIGERNKPGDLEVNIVREKKLTNMRASSADATVVLRPARPLSLDQAIEFIAEDELVEVTPINVRLRKMYLDPHSRKQAAKKMNQ